MRLVLRRTALGVVSVTFVAVVAGCGGNQNALAPHSSAQAEIDRLWWVMLAGSCIGFGVIAVLLGLGWARRKRRIEGETRLTALVVLLGVALPIVVLSGLFVWADIFVVASTAAPAAGSAQLTIRVIAHDWWWQVDYPGTDAVTANEIHVPTNTRVEVIGTTADVIHSFWVPELNRKIDLIPGRTDVGAARCDEGGASIAASARSSAVSSMRTWRWR